MNIKVTQRLIETSKIATFYKIVVSVTYNCVGQNVLSQIVEKREISNFVHIEVL